MAPKPRRPSPMMGSVAELVEELPQTFLNGPSAAQFSHTMELDVDAIEIDPEQARKVFEQEAIEVLAGTMVAQGQLQPILVRRHPQSRGRWVIVAGERRWRAAKHLGWVRILASVYDGDAGVASLLENLQRVDLNLVEEASGLRKLLELRGWTQTQVAEVLGRRVSDISGSIGVLDLPDEFLDQVLNSEIAVSRNALIELARVPAGTARDRLIALARAGKLTIPQIRGVRETATRSENAPFDGRRSARRPPADVPPPLSLKTVGMLRAAVKETRTARRVLGSAEREELQELAREITELLELSDRSFS
jgi:ParB family transcriptional regulator, chromosome partitioning protein